MVDPNTNRNWWRELSSTEEFYDVTGLSPQARGLFRGIIGDTLSARIRMFCGMQLQGWVPSRPKPNDDDDVVNVWFQVYTRLAEDTTSTVDELFLAMLKDHATQATKTESWSAMELTSRSNAFSIPERKSSTGQYPSSAVLDKLLQQYRTYRKATTKWMGPYTTIIGPSGIGKSFAVKQLAVRHGLYVAYTNLAPLERTCYPRPVALGPVPSADYTGREQLTTQWKQYLALQLRLIEACKKEGITPSGLFSLLTKSTRSLVDRRQTLETALKSAVTDADLEAMLVDCKRALAQQSENLDPCGPSPNVAFQPPLVLCFDEARALLDNADNLSFRCLRQAAVELFGERAAAAPFFVVLLDTTSRISNFTPLLGADPSRKQSFKNVFPPIHQIDTWDVLAPDNSPDVDGSEESVTQLFSHGRPLWASFLDNGDAAGDMAALARDKMAVSGDAFHVALLTYRVNVYVTSRQLAETLVASLMRYIVAISDNCSKLLTSQPSEPVLAFAASCELQKPESRLQCIRAWVDALQTGACNLGDVGEMVAALILLFSFDYISRPLSELPHAVRLETFFSALFKPAHWKALHDSHVTSPDVQEVLDDGFVFFNHFVRASSTPTSDSLELAHKRGAALFLPAHFPGMDIAIPIRIRKTGALAVLLVQVKNRHGDSATPGLRMKIAEDLDKAAQKLGTSQLHSVVGLAMCLRCSEWSKPSVDVIRPAPRPFLRRRKTTAPSSSLAPPSVAAKKAHLLAIISGLRGVYPCLETPASESETAEEKSAAAREKERDAMDRVCSLLEELLGKWPDFYRNEDVESAYARKLLDPFYAK